MTATSATTMKLKNAIRFTGEPTSSFNTIEGFKCGGTWKIKFPSGKKIRCSTKSAEAWVNSLENVQIEFAV